MDDREVGRLWDENADAWTKLARMGFDVYRDQFNTPAFFEMLPDVSELRGLDIGCGEGHNTRILARRGAYVTAVDIAPAFIRYALETEAEDPKAISYFVASGLALPFRAEAFDFATAIMSLMDTCDAAAALREASRVLRRGGFLQFSITHPCFDTPYRKWVRDELSEHVGLEVAEYFRATGGEVSEWIFSAAPAALVEKMRKFRVPYFHNTLSWWLNAVADAGFVIERLEEPVADDDAVARWPQLAETRVVGHYLHVRCRKP